MTFSDSRLLFFLENLRIGHFLITFAFENILDKKKSDLNVTL